MRIISSFWFLFTLIAGVSIYDTWLTIRFEDCMLQQEQNPVGRWLIVINGGTVDLFVRFKIAGTVIVLTVLAALYRCRSRSSLPVTGSIAAWQTWLFVYLTFVG